MSDEKKLGLFSLIALVVGSMIGGGAFNLATDMAYGANAGAIIIGWVITGFGIIALALAFQNLTMRRPDLEGGVYSYAKAGFGKFMGFNSAYGYWLSAVLGNVAYATLLFSSIGYFLKPFEGGQNILSIIGASILLWLVHWLVVRGVHSAAFINLVTTIAKLIPIFTFIVIAIVAFNADTFFHDFWGPNGIDFSWGVVKSQLASTMLVTLWVFIGIEGAVVLSARAKDRKDVGRATVIGLLCVLVIYILISLLSLGVMTRGELSELHAPSLAYVLESVVGKWGAIFINIGLIISVLGAWLGWTILAGELPYLAAKDEVFPKWLSKENAAKAPVNSLWLTNGIVQLFLISFLFTDKAYNFMLSLASSAILLPYLFTALYQFKLAYTGEAYQPGEKRTKDLILGVISSLYAFWLVYAAGFNYLVLTMLLYAPGIVLFYKVQKENKVDRTFTKAEAIAAIVIVATAAYALFGLITGKVSI